MKCLLGSYLMIGIIIKGSISFLLDFSWMKVFILSAAMLVLVKLSFPTPDVASFNTYIKLQDGFAYGNAANQEIQINLAASFWRPLLPLSLII